MMGVLLHVPNYIMGVHIHSLHFKAPQNQLFGGVILLGENVIRWRIEEGGSHGCWKNAELGYSC